MQRSRIRLSAARADITSRWLEYAVVGTAFVLVAVAFALLPLPGADDWASFHRVAQMVLAGEIPYGVRFPVGYFYNVPWLAIAIAPLGLLPMRASFGIVMAASLGIIFVLARRWGMSRAKMAAVLLSPPVFYTLLHGNIDVLVLGAVLLPKEWWLAASLTKPQTAIGLALGALDAPWRRTALICAAAVAISFAVMGNWVPAFLASPIDIIASGRNLFMHTWPYQIVVGVILAYIGWKRKDALYLIGASPFFSPYAATSTMLGPLLLLIARRKDWQAVVIVGLYWALSLWGGGAFR